MSYAPFCALVSTRESMGPALGANRWSLDTLTTGSDMEVGPHLLNAIRDIA